MTTHDRYLVRQFNRAFGDIEWQEELTSPQQGLLNLRRLFKDEPSRISSRDLFATLPDLRGLHELNRLLLTRAG